MTTAKALLQHATFFLALILQIYIQEKLARRVSPPQSINIQKEYMLSRVLPVQEALPKHSSADEMGKKPAKLTQVEHIKKYEVIRQKLLEQSAQAFQGKASSLVIENLNALDELYKGVRLENNRDTKVHLKDSEVFKEASDFAAINARNLKFDNNGVTLATRDVIDRMRVYMGDVPGRTESNGNDNNSGENQSDEINDGASTSEETFNRFDWLKLGLLYFKLSLKPVASDFLYGPLATERRKIAPRARNIDDTQSRSLTTASRVVAGDLTTGEEQNTSYMVKSVYQAFREKDDGAGVNFYRFFVNPFSFSQLVENLFFASFLIKDARLNIYTDDKGIPHVKNVNPQEHADAQLYENNEETVHHIASFDYGTWQKLVQEHNITESFLGHRQEPEDVFLDLEIEQDDPIKAAFPGDNAGVDADETLLAASGIDVRDQDQNSHPKRPRYDANSNDEESADSSNGSKRQRTNPENSDDLFFLAADDVDNTM